MNGVTIFKHSKEGLGELTTLTSNTGKTMFVGQEVSKQWGHTNLTMAIKRAELNADEYIVVDFKKYKEFKKQLTKNLLVSGRSRSIILISESGLYKLALSSNLQKGKEFRHWITSEVLPSIRKTGSYTIGQVGAAEMLTQTKREVQIDNSKKVNTKKFKEGGVPAIIDHNRNNCKQVFGCYPNEVLKVAGKKSGSAKEIIRRVDPVKAAVMSMNDHLVLERGAKLEDLKKLDEALMPAFRELQKLGFQITA